MDSANRILAIILPDDFKNYLEQKFPDWQSLIHKGEIRTRVWLKGLVSALLRLTFLAVLVCLSYIAGLYLLRGSWHIFADSMIGSRYIYNVNVARAAEISWVLSLDFMSLGLTITLLTVLVGTISQLTMLRRFFYVGRSSLVKLGWISLACTAVVQRFAGYYQMEFYLAFGLCFLPTMIIFSSVLASAGKLLPELNLLLFMENRREKREIQDLKDDIARLMQEEPGEGFD